MHGDRPRNVHEATCRNGARFVGPLKVALGASTAASHDAQGSVRHFVQNRAYSGRARAYELSRQVSRPVIDPVLLGCPRRGQDIVLRVAAGLRKMRSEIAILGALLVHDRRRVRGHVVRGSL